MVGTVIVTKIIVMIFIFYPTSPITLSSLVINSFCSIAFIPVTLNFAAEVTFPIMPGQINGGLIITMQFATFLIGLLCNYMLQVSQNKLNTLSDEEILKLRQNNSFNVFYFIIATCIFVMFLIAHLKEDLKRFNYSKQNTITQQMDD